MQKTKTTSSVSSSPANPAPTQLRAELDQFEVTVREIVALGLASKTAQIRMLIPAMEKLNQAGFGYEKLIEILNTSGLEITHGTLKSILARERAKAKAP